MAIITQIFNFFGAGAAPAKPSSRGSMPYRENPAKCSSCPDGYYIPVNRDGVSVHECEQCGAVRGIDLPGDIDRQRRVFTGGSHGTGS